MEAGAHRLSDLIVQGSVGDENPLPEQLCDRISLRAPAHALPRFYQKEPVGLRPYENHATETRQRELEDVAEPLMQGL
jgi:hypothetical protein